MDVNMIGRKHFALILSVTVKWVLDNHHMFAFAGTFSVINHENMQIYRQINDKDSTCDQFMTRCFGDKRTKYQS